MAHDDDGCPWKRRVEALEQRLIDLEVAAVQLEWHKVHGHSVSVKGAIGFKPELAYEEAMQPVLAWRYGQIKTALAKVQIVAEAEAIVRGDR